jgi:hypothetical protein
MNRQDTQSALRSCNLILLFFKMRKLSKKNFPAYRSDLIFGETTFTSYIPFFFLSGYSVQWRPHRDIFMAFTTNEYTALCIAEMVTNHGSIYASDPITSVYVYEQRTSGAVGAECDSASSRRTERPLSSYCSLAMSSGYNHIPEQTGTPPPPGMLVTIRGSQRYFSDGLAYK